MNNSSSPRKRGRRGVNKSKHLTRKMRLALSKRYVVTWTPTAMKLSQPHRHPPLTQFAQKMVFGNGPLMLDILSFLTPGPVGTGRQVPVVPKAMMLVNKRMTGEIKGASRHVNYCSHLMHAGYKEVDLGTLAARGSKIYTLGPNQLFFDFPDFVRLNGINVNEGAWRLCLQQYEGYAIIWRLHSISYDPETRNFVCRGNAEVHNEGVMVYPVSVLFTFTDGHYRRPEMIDYDRTGCCA
jgi:hypothetical protein